MPTRHPNGRLQPCLQLATNDRDGDGLMAGTIEVEEFLEAVSDAKLDETHARALFASADADGNGSLDVDEFVRVMLPSADCRYENCGLIAADGHRARALCRARYALHRS